MHAHGTRNDSMVGVQCISNTENRNTCMLLLFLTHGTEARGKMVVGLQHF